MSKLMKYASGSSWLRKTGIEAIKNGELKDIAGDVTLETWNEACDVCDIVMPRAYKLGFAGGAAFVIGICAGYRISKLVMDKIKERKAKKEEETEEVDEA